MQPLAPRRYYTLYPDVIAGWLDNASKPRFMDLAKGARAVWEENPDTLILSLQEIIAFLAVDETAPDWLRRIAAGLPRDYATLKRSVILHPLGDGVIVRGRERIDPQADRSFFEEVDWFTDEDDASASGTTNVSLESHLAGVAALCRRFAEGCALSELAGDLECAGRLHDVGKADPRFQALLKGGNPWAQGDLLAKSSDMPQGRMAYARALRTVGYPEHGRHELLSVRLVESKPNLLPEDSELLDLCLHLIESHHGHCRPFAPVIYDPEPVDVSVDLNGSTLSSRSTTDLNVWIPVYRNVSGTYSPIWLVGACLA